MIASLKETEGNYFCMACITYSHTEKIPKKLKGGARGNFGIFKKMDKTTTRKVNKERRENIKKNISAPHCMSCA